MTKPYPLLTLLLIILSSTLHYPSHATPTETPTHLQAGEKAYQQGAYQQAIQHWETALRTADTPHTIQLLLHIATAHIALGNFSAAHTALQQAKPLLNNNGTPEQKLIFANQLSATYLAEQKFDETKTTLTDALTQARTLKQPLLLAHTLNKWGNLHDYLQSYPTAQTAYEEAYQAAYQAGDINLQTQTLLNQAQLALTQQQIPRATKKLQEATTLLTNQPDSYDKAFKLLSIGELSLDIQTQNPAYLTQAFNAIKQSHTIATQYNFPRLQAYSTGLLGTAYERARSYPEALQYTRQALFYSQTMPDLAYRWEWQRARIFTAQKNLDEAITAYKRALTLLNPIRVKLNTGLYDPQKIFLQRIRPVYFGLADVLLQKARITSENTAKVTLLREARETVESMKIIELEDYFQDECVTIARNRIRKLEKLDKNTAVLYPILLPDRTELLLSIPDDLRQMVVPISAAQMETTVRNFQRNLQTRTKWTFLREAQELYRWIIQPIREELKAFNINTLVIVPDGVLRMIPMAALHDGESYLIDNFAIATTPSVDLTDPQPISRTNISILLNGLSDGVQQFSPLPSVPEELNNIQTLFADKGILLNADFSIRRMTEALQATPYSIIHIASHGQFDRNPRNTFLLTHDDRLTMDRLEELLSLSSLRQQPIELLTLSACQTAVGDERAALGLAGIAIKAGARSALATLWFVNDESTSTLVTEFYSQLKKNPELSKAQALQNAQIKLKDQSALRHPVFWAPFLLIGNWL